LKLELEAKEVNQHTKNWTFSPEIIPVDNKTRREREAVE
jgi:hypothetical protein